MLYYFCSNHRLWVHVRTASGGGSSEYSQSMFRNQKKGIPLHTPVLLHKSGVKGVFITRTFYPDDDNTDTHAYTNFLKCDGFVRLEKNIVNLFYHTCTSYKFPMLNSHRPADENSCYHPVIISFIWVCFSDRTIYTENF